MSDHTRITSLDTKLAHESWSKESSDRVLALKREPVNSDPYAQAALMDRFFKHPGGWYEWVK